MILPTKIIHTKKSLLGIGAIVLQALSCPLTVSSLWDKVKTKKEINSFEFFVLSLDFLYIIGAISYKNGRIFRGKNAL